MAKTKAQLTHRRQQEYVDRIEEQGFDYGPVVAQAFVNSIRDLGYRSVATAADELIDNAIEAGAENVHVAFGFGKSDAKPENIAIMDDGYGMVPGMIRASIVWGGTDREGSRNGFGRYGYGLPSASVSQGQRFTVYSRTDDGDFHAVTLDLEDLRAGNYIVDGKVVVPKPEVAQLPDWVVDYADAHFNGGSSALRTVVVWGKLDRITWKTTKKLETEFLHHFGLVYRGFFRHVTMAVHGKTVEPIDPLFVSEGHRYYDLDEQRAESLPPLEFTVKGDDGKSDSVVRLRISYMPPGFFTKDKSKKATGRNANARFQVRKENNGLIVCRNGRQIDVVTRTPLTTFVNNDRYIGLELDFPATLDEEFGVTTAKQQITISERIWDLLRQHGFLRVLEGLRKRYKEDEGDVAADRELNPELPRPSEQVMSEAGEVMRDRPPNEEQEKQADENLQREIDKMAKESGVDPEAIRQQKEREVSARPFKVERESRPDGPFYRVEQQGGQLVLYVNKSHRFFTDVYNLMGGLEGARIRAAMELLLFVLGQCELDSSGQGKAWYMNERIEWSQRLNMVLTLLDEHIDLVMDDAEVEDEPAEDLT